MASGLEPSPTHYTWRPEGYAAEVHIPFDVVDRMQLDIMSGFGAVPRRGMEIGGLLLGSITMRGDHRVVEVRDFEAIGCEHAQGPSFLLSAKDKLALQEKLGVLRDANSERPGVIGFFRSHTREGLTLASEDIGLLEGYFSGVECVALLVKPFATKPSLAGFFFREGERFGNSPSPLEFPFRRKEMGGGVSAAEKQAAAARFGQNRPVETPNPYLNRPAAGNFQPPAGVDGSRPETGRGDRPDFSRPATGEQGNFQSPNAQGSGAIDAPSVSGYPFYDPSAEQKKNRKGWLWIPLSFIFMLLGVVLGFQVAISTQSKAGNQLPIDAWNLTLAIQKNGDELRLTWDPRAFALKSADKGQLIVIINNEQRRTPLSAAQLSSGNLIYRSVPKSAVFRLEVFPRENVSVSESVRFSAE